MFKSSAQSKLINLIQRCCLRFISLVRIGLLWLQDITWFCRTVFDRRPVESEDDYGKDGNNLSPRSLCELTRILISGAAACYIKIKYMSDRRKFWEPLERFLFLGRGFKCFTPLRVTNSKTKHYLLSYLFGSIPLKVPRKLLWWVFKSWTPSVVQKRIFKSTVSTPTPPVKTLN